jgi:Domain of Unknown Function (DUF1080)
MRHLSLLLGLLIVPPALADDFKPEEGFTLLFNGKDLTGWKTTKGESLDGKTDAYDGRFKAADGVLTIDPKVKGDVRIETQKEFGNDLHIKFDFLPGKGCNNDLFLRGLKFDLKIEDVKEWKQDEWNSFEIVLKGDKAEFKVNDKVIKTMTVKGKGTVFGLRAEFGPMQVRRMRVKEG